MALLHAMKHAQSIDEAALDAYLCPAVGEEAIHRALVPLARAYLRDPDLLRRYNYGRGHWDQPVSDADRRRVQQARLWLERVSPQGIPPSRVAELAQKMPPRGASQGAPAFCVVVG